MGKQIAFILLCLIYLPGHHAIAYNLKQVADKEYMSNSAITSLCQDEHGLMWIGTCDGLNLYDGQEIEEFKPHSGEDYLSGNLIDNIICTGENSYWIQTYYGLNHLDRRTNTLTHYNEFQKLFFMNKDSKGNLFIIKDSNCIYYYHSPTRSFKKINVSGVPISDIVNFFIDNDNRMWIVMKGYSRCYHVRQDPASGELSLSPINTGWHYSTSLLYCFNDEEYLYYIDKEYNFHSFCIASRKSEFIANLSKEIQTRGTVSSVVRYHDSFFVGFLMDGILRLDRQQENETYRIQPLPINSGVFCLKKDRFQDIVWIGTDGQGVFLYSTPLYSIHSVVLGNYTEKIERPVRALFLDDERTLWVGTKGNGILRICDYEVGKDVGQCRSEVLTTSNSRLGSNAVYAFAPSRRNVLWIGDEEGLSYYSYREKQIRKIPIHIEGADFKYIHGIYETDNSDLWLASVGMGVVKAHISGTADHPVLTEVQRYVINNGEFGSNYFFTIYAEDKGDLLFGNKGYGVFRFNEAIRGLEPISSHKYENMTLNNVIAISKDSANRYLFGTSYGLIKYTSATSYSLFNTHNGFSNNTIHAILPNTPSNFWLSTNLGLVNFDTRRDVFRSYGFADGLKVVEFSDGAAYRDPRTGTLFFGGINGFVTIRADGLPEPVYMPPVYFDKLSIFGEHYSLGEFMNRKKGKEVLNLKYNQNFFSVSFASMDYLNGNNCTYYYKLKGLSDQWVNNGSASEVSFTNMAPGEYTLMIKYYNRVFDKESNIYTLLIHISHPWYTTGWAYGIYVLCLLVLIALSVRSFLSRSRHKKLELLKEIEQRHQKNVFESKLRFFTNIAQEFCTPLTLIYGPCERILSSQGLSRFVTDYVQMVQFNAKRLNGLIHELIEFRRIETGNREACIESLDVSLITKNISKTFVEMARTKHITFLSKIPEEAMWNSDKGFLNTIVINLLSNAFKYTPEGKSIKITVDNSLTDELRISVAYEGSRLTEADFKRMFDRYAVFDHPENQDEGTDSRNGLGLAISYNMAKLLNGTLQVESTPDGWLTFTLALPPASPSNDTSLPDRIAAEYIPSIESQPTLTLPDYEQDNNRPTLLIASNDREMLWFIGEMFSTDFNILTAEDKDQVEKVMGNLSPAVIICDASLNGKSCIDLVKKIKESRDTSHIPIIMLSGKHEMEVQMEALSAGVELYITKPFGADLLRTSVAQVMERKEILKNYFSSSISSYEKIDGKLMHKDSKKLLQAVLSIIESNISNPELSPAFIAEKLAISVRSLYRKMEEMGSERPNSLIKECRLHKAKDMLVTTKKTIDEIAFEVGFSNKVIFFKAFREKYACTPREFRIRNEEK